VEWKVNNYTYTYIRNVQHALLQLLILLPSPTQNIGLHVSKPFWSKKLVFFKTLFIAPKIKGTFLGLKKL